MLLPLESCAFSRSFSAKNNQVSDRRKSCGRPVWECCAGKKALITVLLLCSASLFAADAHFLPDGVLKLSLATAFSFYAEAFNQNGDKLIIPEQSGRAYWVSAGVEAEYALNDRLAATFKWTPGFNIWSRYDYQESPYDKLRVSGAYDILTEFKIQILGEKGLLVANHHRIAAALGIAIPFPHSDWERWTVRKNENDTWRDQDVDKHAWGLSSRFAFDFVPSDLFFLNLSTHFIYYLPRVYENVDIDTYALAQAGLAPGECYNYGYELILAAEPHFKFQLGSGVSLGLMLPVKWSASPDIKIDGTPLSESSKQIFTVEVAAELANMNLSVPLSLKASYLLPVAGKNLRAIQQVKLILTSYLKPGK